MTNKSQMYITFEYLRVWRKIENEITFEKIHTKIKITFSEEMRSGQDEVGGVSIVIGDLFSVA